ncbi:TetR/AcrR family transcriptional regulator [Methylomonas paludis]|uniref:TetR/AcrR family transcriptional regulator n=1 Tax=Methylomonas paludis TaxID=1173101 RepID=A0A975R958_9GAMM|nr:TetR/AcrR family transcriptional regulator [Methylomonas paludis]QWF69933.1 TetR/AcrR family transcriptional regulator [Methylomonas paludis]
MARRREHTLEQIREMVLNAAENIIVQEGIDALTVRRIAADIGYTVGSIYMVFANTQELFLHINGRTLDQLTQQLQDIPATDSLELRIKTLTSNYLEYASANLSRWRLLFQPGLVDHTQLPVWYKQKIQLMFDPIEALFGQLSTDIEDAQTQLAAKTLWCGVHGICTMTLGGNLGPVGLISTETAVHLLVDNFIQGWRR